MKPETNIFLAPNDRMISRAWVRTYFDAIKNIKLMAMCPICKKLTVHNAVMRNNDVVFEGEYMCTVCVEKYRLNWDGK